MITVTIKPAPKAKATSLRRFFSITIFPDNLVAEDISSEVISRIIAITASHRLMSDKDIGKFIYQPSTMLYQTSMVWSSGVMLSFWIVIIFPVAFAMAHAMALARGQPRKWMLFRSSAV